MDSHFRSTVFSNIKREMELFLKKITIPRLLKFIRRLPQKIDNLYQERTFKFYPWQLLSESQHKSLKKNGINIIDIEDFRLIGVIDGGRGLPRYQEEIISTGQFKSICPKCGNNCYSERSYPVFVHSYDLPIFYRFRCCYEFYLIFAKSPSMILGIFFPSNKIVISLENYLDYPHNLNYYGLSTFLFWIREFNRLKKAYCLKGQEKTRQNYRGLILDGFLSNFGHHLMDEINGLDQLTRLELSKFEILIGPYDWFGLKEIFHSAEYCELSFENNSRDLIDRVFQFVESTGACATRITSNRPLSNIISNKLIDLSTKNLSEDKIQLLSVIDGTPKIWITLRSHIRNWDNEVDGLSKVINMLFQSYPNMVIIFDGLGSEIANCDLIKNKIHPWIKTFSVLGFSINDTIPFVSKCDIFIAPLGAGVILSTIPDISGIVHTHMEWTKQNLNLRIRKEDYSKYLVIGGEITSGKDEFEFNYNISPQELFEKTMQLLGKLGFEAIQN